MTGTAPSTAVTMTGAQFHRLLTAVLPSAATDDVLPQLKAVHLETGPHGVYAAATDRYSFAVARHADPAPARRPAQLTVPRHAVVVMRRLARRRDAVASIRIAAGYLTLRTAAGVTYRTPGIDTRGCGGFPDWRRIFTRLLASPQEPGGQPVYLNPVFLARFTAATDKAGLRVTVHRAPGQHCHTLVITAGDWFLGALMSMASPATTRPPAPAAPGTPTSAPSGPPDPDAPARTAHRKDTPAMANEPTTTITGNLTADPELRFTPTGRPVAAFTIANTPRFPDRTTGQWTDGETWFVRCSAWGDMAENITTSLSKGNAVVATGRLRSRTWETPEGDKRSVVEMTVDDLGPSLRRAIVKLTKATREHPAAGETPGAAAYDGPSPAPAAADQWSTPAPAPVPAAEQAAGGPDEPPF